MSQVIFHFHGGLDYFLATEAQNNPVAFALAREPDGKVAVKHAIESLGVPHTEVDQIVANGQEVGFDHALNVDERIDVWAWMPRPDRVSLRPPLPRPVRFVLDTHLGRLATYLRLLGIDTLYHNGYDDETLAELSQREARVLLTRDRGLLKRRIVDFGYCVRETNPKEQIVSLLHAYRLRSEIEPWRRCLRCNALLEAVDKAEVLAQLEPKTKRYFEDFRRCQGCGQVYWRGSHYDRMQAFVIQLLAQAAG